MITFRLPRPGIRLFQPNKILALLWLFLLVFPKGGFKIAGVPLTWGYLLLGLVSLYPLFQDRFVYQAKRTAAFCCVLPLQIISALSFFTNGIDEVSFGISFILNFFFFPFFFYIILSEQIDAIDLKFLCKLIKIGVFFIATYGIILFAIKMMTGKIIEIPFLTTNYHDYGKIGTKCNDRGWIFKLISTYNNGNIYGICLLMIFPLYEFLETSKWKKLTVVLSLILSLSRTVWVGLIFSQILTTIFVQKRNIFLNLIIPFVFFAIAITAIAFFLGFDFSFLFDRTLGGRIGQFEIFETMSLFPNKPFEGILEIVYLGILSNFGILGLFSYLIAMTSPIALIFLLKSHFPLRKSILCGLVNFLFLSSSDGALLYVPVLVFYWFLSSLMLRNVMEEFDDLSAKSQIEPMP
jgi:hypothetical protein